MRRSARTELRRLLLLGALAGLHQPAAAQAVLNSVRDLTKDADAVKEAVAARGRPDYDADGLPLGDLIAFALQSERTRGPREPQPLRPGDTAFRTADFGLDDLNSFTLFPRVELSTSYDDNVFRTPGGRQGDVFHVASPQLELKSDWVRHQVDVLVDGQFGRYADFDSEDFDDASFVIAPRLDVDDNTTIALKGSFARGHVGRDVSEAALEAGEPGVFYRHLGSAVLSYQADAYLLQVRYNYDRLDYRDVDGLDRDDQDYAGHFLFVRQGWEFFPGTVAWVEPAYAAIEFDDSFSAFGQDRDARGYQVLAGVTYNASDVAFAEIGAGYLEREFDDPAIERYSGFAAQGRVVWNVTDLISLEAIGSRRLSLDRIAIDAWRRVHEIEVKAAWDPLENLIFEIGASYEDAEYLAQERDEQSYVLRASARYLFNSNMYMRAAVSRFDQRSSEGSEAYDFHLFTLALGLRL